jgi:acyl-coenzyme A synthetase/AMP-(fatty) acid ligase
MTGSIPDQLEAASASNPAATALMVDGRAVSFSQLLRLVDSAARQLYDGGIRPGVHVGLTLAAAPLHFVALLALARMGAVSVPLPVSLGPVMRARLARKFGLAFVVSDSAQAGVEGTAFVPLARVGSEVAGSVGGYRPRADTPARIILTSGTTGEPKGVLCTHAELLQRFRDSIEGAGPGTRLIAPDLHISIGSTHPLGTVCSGGTVIFPPNQGLETIVSSIQLHAATHLFCSPWTVQQLLQRVPTDGPSCPSLRELRIVGGSMPAALLEPLRRRVTPGVYLTYGTTELGLIALATPADLDAAPSSTGRIRPGVRIDVLNDQGDVLSAGQRGQLRVVVKDGPAGYFRESQERSAAFRDGRFHTGDLGWVDAQGRVYIEGRIDDVLDLGGYKVLPQEIEALIDRHPRVRESAVAGVRDADGLLTLRVFIVPEGEPSGKSLLADLVAQLGPAAPTSLQFVERLPRTGTGKIQRSALRPVPGET